MRGNVESRNVGRSTREQGHSNGGFGTVTCGNGTMIDLTPLDGTWTQTQYLRLTDHSRSLLEFTDGCIEVLPMPTDRHQVISRFLFLALFRFVERIGGAVLYAPLRLRIREGKFREPNILLVRDANDSRRQNDYWRGADWVVEVVSPDDPDRDIRVKRFDYAEAGIPEYWIVNPIDESVTVLALRSGTYEAHGAHGRGQRAESLLLQGFSVDVGELFDAS